jgi:hypothetical protein
MPTTLPRDIREFGLRSRTIEPDPLDEILRDHAFDPLHGVQGRVRTEAEQRVARMRTLNQVRGLLKEYLKVREDLGLNGELRSQLRPEAVADREAQARRTIVDRFVKLADQVRSNAKVPKVPDLESDREAALITKLQIMRDNPEAVATLVQDLVMRRDLPALKAVAPLVEALTKTEAFQAWERTQPASGSLVEKALAAADALLNDSVEANVAQVVEEELEAAQDQLALAFRTVHEEGGWRGVATRMEPSPFSFFDLEEPSTNCNHPAPTPPEPLSEAQLAAMRERYPEAYKALVGGEDE